MEIKKHSIIVTKDGEYYLTNMMTLFNPFNLNPTTIYVIDVNGEEKRVFDKDIISVKNNHLENIEEP